MEFEKTIQGALKTLRTSLKQHEEQKLGYERTIIRLNELTKNVPRDSTLPVGEIISILRRSLPIQDFSVLLSLDLRTVLSPSQIIEIIRNAKATIDSQIQEIHKEIADANQMSILSQGNKEVLNEEGLPIKDIREDVFQEDEGPRAVLAEEENTRTYTMEEIDKMMDEAAAEEQAEMEALQQKSSTVQKLKEKEKEEKEVDATAGQGLEVGQVNGEELLAKLVDDNKKRYNPVDDIWMEDEEELGADDHYYDDEHDDEDDDEEEEEDEEDQYGRTRGYLIPPGLYPGSTKERGVKFASFEKPAEPSLEPISKPVKSALKKSATTVLQSPLPTSSTAPLLPSGMATNIVERDPNRNDTPQKDTKVPRKISLFKAARQGI